MLGHIEVINSKTAESRARSGHSGQTQIELCVLNANLGDERRYNIRVSVSIDVWFDFVGTLLDLLFCGTFAREDNLCHVVADRHAHVKGQAGLVDHKSIL
jgi:hypothetical protein